jgi:lambda repressor-like predicted transcriptional regulator
MALEPVLRRNLLTLAGRYMKATGVAMSSLSKKAHSDSAFLSNLTAKKVSFSARKYDEMITWFWRHWPPKARWPSRVYKPTQFETHRLERANRRKGLNHGEGKEVR